MTSTAQSAGAFNPIQLTHLVPSKTNPRKHFDPAALAELAESIKVHGILQPILVRRISSGGTASNKFEIIAGERRYRAAGLAKFDMVPAICRDLNDDEVIAIQLIENLQREDLTALEEAQGYQELLRRKGPDGKKNFTVDEIAKSVGKSKGYVYHQMKLLDLCAEVLAHVTSGELEVASAVAIARIPFKDAQIEAADYAMDDNMSHREVLAMIQREYTFDLDKRAPFDIKLVYEQAPEPYRRACNPCPDRSGNARDLYPEIKGANVCTNASCYKAKCAAEAQVQLEKAQKSGKTVLQGKDAEKILEKYSSHNYKGFARLDAHIPGTNATYKQVLGKADVETVLVMDPRHPGKPVEVVNVNKAYEALREKKIKFADPSKERDSAAKLRKDAQLHDQARKAMFLQAREAIKDDLSEPILITLIEQLLANFHGDRQQLIFETWAGASFNGNWGAMSKFMSQCEQEMPKLPAFSLRRMLVDLVLLDAVVCHNSHEVLEQLLKKHKLDFKKIHADLKAEAEAAEKAAKSAKAAKPAKVEKKPATPKKAEAKPAATKTAKSAQPPKIEPLLWPSAKLAKVLGKNECMTFTLAQSWLLADAKAKKLIAQSLVDGMPILVAEDDPDFKALCAPFTQLTVEDVKLCLTSNLFETRAKAEAFDTKKDGAK